VNHEATTSSRDNDDPRCPATRNLMSKTESANADCLQRLVRRIDGLEARIKAIEKTSPGYRCKICGTVRPADWFIYEIEVEGEWLRSCCAECARLRGRKSRGPYPPNDPKLSHGHRSVTPKCKRDNQISYHRRNARRGGRWLQRGVRPLVIITHLAEASERWK
jgi:hypothetical protein